MPMAAAMVFHGPGRPLELARIPIPELRPGEVLVRVTACTLCGSDVHTFSGRRTTPVPIVLGHEMLGSIVDVGTDAPTHDPSGHPLRIGDRVTWSIVANCGACFYCQRGLPAKCERGIKFGHELLRTEYPLTGGLAEYCVLPIGASIFRLPDDLSDEVACPANCATATTAAVFDAAGSVAGRTVLVLGAGMLGLTACVMAHLADAAAVICSDVAEQRRQRALDFGASALAAPENLSAVVADLTSGYGVDVVLELSGSTDALEHALPLVRLGGIVVLAGAVFPSRAMQLEPERIVRRNLTLHGVHNYAPRHLEAAINFLVDATRKYPLATLVSEWMPLAAAEKAFEQARGAQTYRIGIRC